MVTAASFSSEISGIQRHAFNVVRCLLRRPEITGVDLVIAPWQTELVRAAGIEQDRLTTHVAEMGTSSLSRNLWYYRGLPALTGRLQPDLLHLSYPVPIDTAALACPTVLSLHDLYPYEIPQNFGFPQVIVNRVILRQCLSRVDAIACVSETTMLRMRRYAPRATWKKAVRIYNCVEPEPRCATRSPIPGWQSEPFLLSIAQHRRNKNIALLIQVFHRLLRNAAIDPKMKLVVVGIPGPETPRIHQMVSQLGLSRSVVLLRGLSEPELQWCYLHCDALVAPSKTEGFGLPVAEALLVGCRVICSDIAAFREIGAGHCRFFALGKDEEEALAAAIRITLQEPIRKPLPLPHLSAEILAKQYLALYRSLLHIQGAESASTLATIPERQLYEGNQPSRFLEQGG
jgi:glycosyltransferase involved in cell wall biosynthesis